MRLSPITFIFFSNIALVSSAPTDLSSYFSADRLDSDAAGYHNEHPHIGLRAEVLSSENRWNGRDDHTDDGYHYANGQILYRGNSPASYQIIQRRQPTSPSAHQPPPASLSEQRQSPVLPVGDAANRTVRDLRLREHPKVLTKDPPQDELKDADVEKRREMSQQRYYERRRHANKEDVPEWARLLSEHEKRKRGRKIKPPSSDDEVNKRRADLRNRVRKLRAERKKASVAQPPSHQPPSRQPPSRQSLSRQPPSRQSPSRQPPSRQSPSPRPPSTPPSLPASQLVGKHTLDPDGNMVWRSPTPQHPRQSPPSPVNDINSTLSSPLSLMRLSDYVDSRQHSPQSPPMPPILMDSTPSPPQAPVDLDDYLNLTHFTPSSGQDRRGSES